MLAEGDVVANAGRETSTLVVINTGDRPIQVGSHFHFFEVNKALSFDRAVAFGMRLNIPSGTAVRFEPGDDKTVTLVRLGGQRCGARSQQTYRWRYNGRSSNCRLGPSRSSWFRPR